jgi:hypothetical protein
MAGHEHFELGMDIETFIVVSDEVSAAFFSSLSKSTGCTNYEFSSLLSLLRNVEPRTFDSPPILQKKNDKRRAMVESWRARFANSKSIKILKMTRI